MDHFKFFIMVGHIELLPGPAAELHHHVYVSVVSVLYSVQLMVFNRKTPRWKGEKGRTMCLFGDGTKANMFSRAP